MEQHTKQPQKEFLTTALLSLFLGWLGVDRFYLGKVGTGILKLVTFGGFGIWYLIDLILILTGSMRSKDGQVLTGRDRHLKIALIVGGVLLILGVVVGMGNSGSSSNLSQNNASTTTPPADSKQQEAAQQEQQPEETVSGLNQPARDGKFEFTVSAVNCGQKVLGSNPYLKEEAQGEFCILDVSIKNIGNEPQTLFADNQYVFNESGQKYSYASGAIFALDDVSNIWLKEINPGNTLNGKLPFDVPAGTRLVEAELHDSAFSNGVKVKLQ